MKRTKKKVINNVSFDQAQEASARYSEISNNILKMEAKINERINLIKDEYQEKIVQLSNELEQHFELLEVYAKEQKVKWGKRKSLEMLHSVIGFRTGTHKVTKDKKFTWDGIVELVKEKFPSLIRIKIELDKEAIIAMRDDEDFLKLKKSCYVDVVQDESFYVEPKKEELQIA
jgi:phage host-nuclease inhibitor protein Gam